MKKDFSFKSIVLPAVVLLLTAGIITALLAGTNTLTKDKIAQQNEKKQIETLQTVLPPFDEYETGTSKNGNQYYISKAKDGEIIGYAFITANNGYGGAVSVMTGITTDNKISGVAILEHGETPGLGANAAKEDFRNQYKQDIPESNKLAVTKDGGTIDAITGATITSRAVTNSVNDAIALYNEVREGK